MIDLSKYIGKNYEEYDCYSLFRAIQKELGYDLPEFKRCSNPYAVAVDAELEKLTRYVRLDKPEMYCAVLMYNHGIPSHIACYVGDGRIIHSTSERGVCIDDLNMSEVEGFYGVRQ